MVTHSRILPWKTPWSVEPGGLQSMEVTKNLMRLSMLTHRDYIESRPH